MGGEPLQTGSYGGTPKGANSPDRGANEAEQSPTGIGKYIAGNTPPTRQTVAREGHNRGFQLGGRRTV